MSKKTSRKPEIQGEGDYKAARRFNSASREFVQSHDVEALARKTAPRSAREAEALARAEARGKSRAKGEQHPDAKPRRKAAR